MQSRMTHGKRKTEARTDLQPGSFGSNVLIKFNNETICKIHYAVLLVRWSYVNVLEYSCRQNNKTRTSLIMEVDLAKVKRGGVLLFPPEEDFFCLFHEVFVTHFVSLVHDQFNISRAKEGDTQNGMHCDDQSLDSFLSAYIELSLPADTLVCFKLLIISERLDAKLQYDIFKHMIQTMDKKKAIEILKLFIADIKVVNIPVEDSLQAAIIQEAIKQLIASIPMSLPTIEDLVYLSTSKQKPGITVQLFQESTTFFLVGKNKNTESNTMLESQRVRHFLKTLKERLERNHSHSYKTQIFSEFKMKLDCYKSHLSGILSTKYAQREQALLTTILTNGIVVEKFGTGLVCIWCQENSFRWMTLSKLRRQRQGFWIPFAEEYDFVRSPMMHQQLDSNSFEPRHRKSASYSNWGSMLIKISRPSAGEINRNDIFSVRRNKDDPFQASFQLIYAENRAQKKITFRARNKQSCDIYVEILNSKFLKCTPPAKNSGDNPVQPASRSRTANGDPSSSPTKLMNKLKKFGRRRTDSNTILRSPVVLSNGDIENSDEANNSQDF